MPNSTLRFPSREERKSLLESLKLLEPQGLNDKSYAEHYQAYLRAMEELDRKMEAASATDEDGLLKTLTEEDRQTLLEALAGTAEAGEKLIVYAAGLVREKRRREKESRENESKLNLINDEPPAAEPEPPRKLPEELMAETVNQLQGLAAADFNSLTSYDPEQPKSLPELQADARTQTIDLRGRKLGSVGNQQNSRIPMKLVNGKGEKINGFFTKATYVNTYAVYQKLIDKAKQSCPNEKDRDRLDNLLESYRKLYHNVRLRGIPGSLDERTEPHVVLGNLLNRFYSHYGDEGELEYKELENEKHFKTLFKGLPEAALKILAKGFSEMKNNASYEMSSLRLGLPDKSRLDNRNSCMSCVANLLGASGLVAKSVNMKFVGEDGTITEGSFMEHARGVDLYQNRQLFQHVAKDPFSDPNTRGNLFKQIADLQVIDYICMNQDRHFGNLFYELDQNGQIIGIQGIDNDCSFARATHFNDTTKDLKVISQSMADKIAGLTPEMLRFSLRGQGLTELELKAAGIRLERLQEAVRNKTITTLSDEEFAQKTIKELESGENHFNKIGSMTRLFRERYNGKDGFTPLPEQKAPDFKEVGTNARKMTVGGLKDSLAGLSRLVRSDEDNFRVEKLTTFFRGSSPAFKNLVTAAKQLDLDYRNLKRNQQLRDEQFLNEESAMKALEGIYRNTKTLGDAATIYLRYKAGPNGDPDTLRSRNPYEQAHIDYARSILRSLKAMGENAAVLNKDDEILLQDNLNRKAQKELREQGDGINLNLSF